MRGFENYRPDKKSLLQIIRILFIGFLTNALKKMAIVYCTVYTQLCTQHTYACYYIFSPNKLRLIERESTILSSVFSNRAFNPGAATGIPVSKESLVLEGTQK